MEYANIIYTVDNGIATIKLNRPKALNALNSEINADIMAAINEGRSLRPRSHHDRFRACICCRRRRQGDG